MFEDVILNHYFTNEEISLVKYIDNKLKAIGTFNFHIGKSEAEWEKKDLSNRIFYRPNYIQFDKTVIELDDPDFEIKFKSELDKLI